MITKEERKQLRKFKDT